MTTSRVFPNFSFSVNGAAPVAFEADGSNVVNLPSGTYTITEPAVTGYAASLSNCSGLVLAAKTAARALAARDRRRATVMARSGLVIGR